MKRPNCTRYYSAVLLVVQCWACNTVFVIDCSAAHWSARPPFLSVNPLPICLYLKSQSKWACLCQKRHEIYIHIFFSPLVFIGLILQENVLKFWKFSGGGLPDPSTKRCLTPSCTPLQEHLWYCQSWESWCHSVLVHSSSATFSCSQCRHLWIVVKASSNCW